MPNYEAVESSNIESVAYEDSTLYVKFLNGSEYAYEGVPQSEYEALKNAPSVGKHLNNQIKGTYSFTRIA